ncbi:efflux RND transporter periplasmic adaptor subunit [Thermus thermamylovorans]|uniref:HlyD family efflux transporter periplasmic adaptor subunit n=1 Tax=Thermus thermamylovorans TaxID=2509362 RepID=A0A4Q9B5W7_9DEIN|nr:HlyD family efflux transporter periplasmic adaptor subunit [Thermus thermamylovorans]TBH21026.1 HlyD family efflux transporter periplasmic adaptor subunit [Thermus thermamylovorans]
MRPYLLLLLLVLAACAPRRAEPPQEAPSPPALAAQVRVVEARPGLLEREARASATLRPERESLVAAGASGRVVRALPAGTRVGAGEGVVFLDPAPFREALEGARLALRQAEANLERTRNQLLGSRAALLAQLRAAEVQLEAARRRYVEGQALLQAGALAPLDLQGLEAQLRQAEGAYENAKEALERLERAEDLRLLELQVEAARLQVAQAERALRESVVRAPFAGEVVEVLVREGEFLGTGSPAFRLATPQSLLAKALLPPEEAARLGPGTPFRLVQGGVEAEARLLRRTDLPGQAQLVEVVLQPAEGSGLLPGAAEVRFPLPLAEGVLVPAGALVVRGGEAQVFRVVEGEARSTPVRLLAQEGELAAVAGLPPGSLLVFPVPEGLRDGDRVEVVR